MSRTNITVRIQPQTTMARVQRWLQSLQHDKMHPITSGVRSPTKTITTKSRKITQNTTEVPTQKTDPSKMNESLRNIG